MKIGPWKGRRTEAKLYCAPSACAVGDCPLRVHLHWRSLFGRLCGQAAACLTAHPLQQGTEVRNGSHRQFLLGIVTLASSSELLASVTALANSFTGR